MLTSLVVATTLALSVAPGKQLRFGIIGTGCIGQEHLRNLHLIPECQVVAIADNHEPSLAAGRETLRKQGADEGVVCVADYRELLALPQVDAVLVATPNDHHRACLRDVAASGKHCLVVRVRVRANPIPNPHPEPSPSPNVRQALPRGEAAVRRHRGLRGGGGARGACRRGRAGARRAAAPVLGGHGVPVHADHLQADRRRRRRRGRRAAHAHPNPNPNPNPNPSPSPSPSLSPSPDQATRRSHAPVVDLDDDLDERTPGAPLAVAGPHATDAAPQPPFSEFSSTHFSGRGEQGSLFSGEAGCAALHIEEVD